MPGMTIDQIARAYRLRARAAGYPPSPSAPVPAVLCNDCSVPISPRTSHRTDQEVERRCASCAARRRHARDRSSRAARRARFAHLNQAEQRSTS